MKLLLVGAVLAACAAAFPFRADLMREGAGRRQPVAVADLSAYVRSLRPTVLLYDTRVTNHGYRDTLLALRRILAKLQSANWPRQRKIHRSRGAGAK